ncbi:hypothetical protein [Nonomuraea soli]|uniref:Allene oxide cyclase barrel-like domain-containing protein n=1 Tax=Nonomuraea soli TaxID=1032476 RepID=A0A7W0CP78_9ACTN|nr:hypothetical protein [Nonomuraea soli]MBA2894692.1 hypothetical protein [Nonomuraea soli]
MRLRPILCGIVLTAGLVPAVPAHAAAAGSKATYCSVSVYSVYAGDIAERDGRDEIRIKAGGNLYPGDGFYKKFRTGDTFYSAAFDNAATTVDKDSDARFSLREVKPPAAGGGTNLGSFRVTWKDCKNLQVGSYAFSTTKRVSGKYQTKYDYRVVLKITGRG